MSNWEEVYLSGEPSLLDRIDQATVFEAIANAFPTEGTKIDWSEVDISALHTFHFDCKADAEILEAAMRSIADMVGTEGRTIHVGDGPSPWGVVFDNSKFMALTKSLIAIPEHHYFIGEGYTWLAAVSLEGHVYFSPNDFSSDQVPRLDTRQ